MRVPRRHCTTFLTPIGFVVSEVVHIMLLFFFCQYLSDMTYSLPLGMLTSRHALCQIFYCSSTRLFELADTICGVLYCNLFQADG